MTCVKWLSQHPQLLFGGTDSGQVLQWDLRAHSRHPVLKSLVGVNGAHSQRIVDIHAVGGGGHHQMATMSTDGQFCAWQMDMLAQPVESHVMGGVGRRNGAMESAVTAFTFSHADNSSYLVGMGSGAVH